MRIAKTGSTMRQQAYARRVFSGSGKSKSEIALDVGYSRFAANSPKSKIESKRGFHNAIAKLAKDSNELALAAMHELKGRGFDDFTNKEIISAVGTLAAAWKTFSEPLIKQMEPQNQITDNGNRLRSIVLQRVEKQIVESPRPINDPAHVEEIMNDVENELEKEGIIEQGAEEVKSDEVNQETQEDPGF